MPLSTSQSNHTGPIRDYASTGSHDDRLSPNSLPFGLAPRLELLEYGYLLLQRLQPLPRRRIHFCRVISQLGIKILSIRRR